MIDAQTATAFPPLPVRQRAFFLTTNHDPLTTVFPAHAHSMIKTGARGTQKQASEGAGKAGVSLRRAESRELKSEDCFPLFRSLAPAARSRRNPTVGLFSSAANLASSADSAAFPLPVFPLVAFPTANRYSRTAASPVPVFLITDHCALTTVFTPPPHPSDPTPPCSGTHPPMPVCETVKL